ncbi:amino acid ABC transporter substrate-binding protein [Alteromonas portus]|uniref:Amino acid ABC transporter substrate-binding protein n=1 Tax=Alteromonas portus TaxID=2565549 RepID=A0A4U0ZMZ7_9ALTE|nr:amino acid ABC transporter substrate-binding protein [Alteromonas portus]
MYALARLTPLIQRVFSISLLVNVSLFSDTATADEILRYNLGTSGNSIPYENAVDEDRAGILVEILPLIMDRADIKTEKVMLSTKRAMLAFKTGDLDFDFFSPSWLSKDEPAGDFTFSDPIIDITEYFITLPENHSRYPTVTSIYGETVGMISGYVYFDSDKFVRMDFQAENNLISALGAKRIDVIIMEEASARYWSSIHDINIALGPIHTAGKMALRLHNRHKDKLPAINRAIAEIKQTGQIERILNKYSDFSL